MTFTATWQHMPDGFQQPLSLNWFYATRVSISTMEPVYPCTYLHSTGTRHTDSAWKGFSKLQDVCVSRTMIHRAVVGKEASPCTSAANVKCAVQAVYLNNSIHQCNAAYHFLGVAGSSNTSQSNVLQNTSMSWLAVPLLDVSRAGVNVAGRS